MHTHSSVPRSVSQLILDLCSADRGLNFGRLCLWLARSLDRAVTSFEDSLLDELADGMVRHWPKDQFCFVCTYSWVPALSRNQISRIRLVIKIKKKIDDLTRNENCKFPPFCGMKKAAYYVLFRHEFWSPIDQHSKEGW